MKSIIITLLFFSLMGCAREKIDFSENRTLVNDSYIKLDLTIEYENYSVNYKDNFIIPYNISIPDSCNNEIKYDLWQPAFNEDYSKLIIFIGGIQTNNKILYPLAFKLLKEGFNICFINLRNQRYSSNKNFNRNNLCNEINDLEHFINFYKDNYNIINPKIGIYSVSVGGVIAINYAVNNFVDILITEGMPYDLEESFKRLTKNEKIYSTYNQSFNEFSLNNIRFENVNSNLFSIWSNNDELIPMNEVNNMITVLENHFNNFEYKIIDSDEHTFRYIINDEQYEEINKTITDKFIEFMKN